jgi:hypothetical protein
LRDSLLKVDRNESLDLLFIERAIGICSSALLELREFVNQFNFIDKEEEIYFFKVTKPYVLSEYLFYSKLFEIEAKQSVTSIKARKKYLKRMISEAQFFFDENPEFFHYYRIGSDHLDDKYFVRTNISCYFNCHHYIVDPCFSTSHDYTLSAIKAYEKVIDYCKNEITNLKLLKRLPVSPDGTIQFRTNLTWTEKKRALIELIYAILSSGAVNNGKADINEMVSAFEIVFNIKLPRFYHVWFEIRSRKPDKRTWFIDLMKKCLLKRMDDADEK